MKLSLIVVLTGLVCCTPTHKGKPTAADQVIQELDSTGVGWDPLTPNQIAEIERIHTAFSEVNSRSLDQTLNHFKGQQNPDREIAVWLKMAHVYERFTLNKHIEEYDKKYEAYQLILLRSSMTEDDINEKTDIIYLTKDEVREILNYYNETGTTPGR